MQKIVSTIFYGVERGFYEGGRFLPQCHSLSLDDEDRRKDKLRVGRMTMVVHLKESIAL
jgi:hypothetical protein